MKLKINKKNEANCPSPPVSHYHTDKCRRVSKRGAQTLQRKHVFVQSPACCSIWHSGSDARPRPHARLQASQFKESGNKMEDLGISLTFKIGNHIQFQ